MKIDMDMKERINIFMLFLLQSYKVLMGSMLLVFVPQSCGDDEHVCSITEIVQSDDVLNRVGMGVNSVTTFIFILYYFVELHRENICIQYLDIDQNKGDNNLSNEIGNYPVIRNKIIKMNNLYYSSTMTALVAYSGNLILSTVILYKNYYGMATTTSYMSFVILILIKLYNSYFISMDTKYNFNSLSAYMTEFQSFNVIDKDYRTKLEIKQINANEFSVVSLEDGENTVMNPLHVDTKCESKNELPKKRKSWGMVANLNLFN